MEAVTFLAWLTCFIFLRREEGEGRSGVERGNLGEGVRGGEDGRVGLDRVEV